MTRQVINGVKQGIRARVIPSVLTQSSIIGIQQKLTTLKDTIASFTSNPTGVNVDNLAKLASTIKTSIASTTKTIENGPYDFN